MPLVTAKELALELNLSAKQIRRMALRGKIPALRFNSEWRFDLAQVKAAAIYTDPLTASARRAARTIWLSPRRRV